MVKPINSLFSRLDQFIDKIAGSGHASLEQKQRLRRFVVVMLVGIPTIVLGIAFQLGLYFSTGITQALYAAILLFMAILFAGIAHFVNKAGRLRLATLVLLTDVVLMSGSLAFVYSGADYYLFFGGAFLVLLIGLLLMPVDWLWWQPFYLILIGIIWLGGQTSFIERFSIQSSLALRIFFPVVTIAIGLTAVLEFMRHQHVVINR